MEIEIANLILKNGLAIVIMALIVMCLVGIVKIFTKGVIERKVVSDKQKKWLSKLYLGLALIFSGIVVVFYYLVILKQDVWSYAALKDIGIVWTVTSPLYQIYKQFGGRRLLVAIVSALQKLFKGKNNDIDDILNIIMTVLNEQAPLLTDAQKEAIQNNLTENLNNK